ncbi:MAG: hypothetical protein E6R03_12090 [Hyphomicrobiaceae bacterium]|nr:MAG: hypothetical protein E6R03_12090 [Hyphomicrobiaceae bacterium]
MDEKSSPSLDGLRHLEIKYQSDIKQIIGRIRAVERERLETDVVQLVLDREHGTLRNHLDALRRLRRELRSWKKAGQTL